MAADRPYDPDALADHVIEHSRREDALAEPNGEVREIDFAEGELTELRATVAEWARAQQLATASAEALVLAVSELAANSVRFGGGRGTLSMWRESNTLMCEVGDGGRIAEPLARGVLRQRDSHAGRGLSIVNQLCDLVQIRSSRAGTSVRVHKLLDD